MKLSIWNLYRPIAKITRKRRMKRFEAMLQPHDDLRIIDIGGHPFNWQFLAARPHVVLLNPNTPKALASSNEQFTHVWGDGRCLDFDDQAFDIAYSNSVIEHVGDWQFQKRFAAEARRVGKMVWVQTPAKCFPVEPHLLTLFVHWLPRRLSKQLFKYLSLRRIIDLNAKQIEILADEVRLLSYKEMKILFPDCDIYIERFLGWPKSYIAVRQSR